MEYLLSKFRKKESKKEITVEELQDIILRTQPPPKTLNLSTNNYSEVLPNVYVGDW